MPAALYFGSCTFAMIAPGAPQVQNIIPTQGFGVDLMAGTVVGFISSILMLLIGSFWLSVMIKTRERPEKYLRPGMMTKMRRAEVFPVLLYLLYPCW